MNFWAKLLVALFFLIFLIPGLYVLGVDAILNGWIVKGVEYLIYIMLVPFAVYPFWKGVGWYKSGKKVFGVLSFLLGMVMPIVSGFFGAFIFLITTTSKQLYSV